MTSPNAPTGKLLALAYMRYEAWLRERFVAAGHPELRPKHGAVLGNLDPSGSRPSELARRAGMGKPAMGELIDELVAAGYLERTADPSDGRARLVVPTAQGIHAMKAGRRITAEVEGEVRKVTGSSAYANLRVALTSMVDRGQSG